MTSPIRGDDMVWKSVKLATDLPGMSEWLFDHSHDLISGYADEGVLLRVKLNRLTVLSPGRRLPDAGGCGSQSQGAASQWRLMLGPGPSSGHRHGVRHLQHASHCRQTDHLGGSLAGTRTRRTGRRSCFKRVICAWPAWACPWSRTTSLTARPNLPLCQRT